MHARHRSPGNGYRSGSMGLGIAASGISPDGSVRGLGSLYGSEHRSFNRPTGFGRGQGYSKSLQQPQPPPPTRRAGCGDIFMDAGRLAAEYLVSQGLLPPSALSVEMQNGSLKKENSEFHELRPLVGDNLQFPADIRPSALATRLGNTAPDSVLGRRRLSDDFSPNSLRNHAKGRRRAASSCSSGSAWGDREYGRSASFPDKSRGSPDVAADADTNSSSGYNDHCQFEDVDDGLRKSNPTELVQKNENTGSLESELIDDVYTKTCSNVGKDLPRVNNDLLTKISNNIRNPTGAKDSTSIDEAEGKCKAENLSVQVNAVDCDPLNKHDIDLLAFCRFAKVPTKIRSSLTCKGSKTEVVVNEVEETPSDTDPEPKLSVDGDGFDGSTSDALSKKTQDMNLCVNSDNSKPLPIDDTDIADKVSPIIGVEQDYSMCSQSFPDGTFMAKSEQMSTHGPPVLERSSSMFEERSQKRSSEESNIKEGTKKPREFLPSIIVNERESFQLPDSSKRRVSSNKGNTTRDIRIAPADCASSLNKFQFPDGEGDPCIEYAQEKQLFPSSFKICDLNLMEAADMQENHDNDPILFFPSISERKRELSPVEIDVAISNSNESGGNGVHVAVSKEIEIIDLENDSAQEDKAFQDTERKPETMLTSLEGFPNPAPHSNDTPDVQDGYGLMISELLGADFPNCSSVQGDISSLQNEMSLHNGEGALADDDSIYMSLGEIPLTFLRAWEQQPPQEYEKPF